MAKQKIALLRLSALGDVCLITPLVHELAAYFPDAEIDWVIDKANLPLVKDFPGCRLLPIEKPRSLVDYWRLFKQFRSSKYDILLVAQANFRVNCLSRCIRAKKRYGFGALHSRDAHFLFVNHHVASYPEHLTDAFMRFGQALGIGCPAIKWALPMDQEADTWARMLLSKQSFTLAVCLSASKSERDWPIEHWIALLQRLNERYSINIIAIGGGAPRELAQAKVLVGQCGFVQNFVGKTSIEQLKALIEHADALISPDTAPVHIAVAVNTPVIGLYAVAPMAKTGPYKDARWSVDCYDLAVKQYLNKDPQAVSWRQRVHHPKAMSLITVDAVDEKCTKLFFSLGLSKRVAVSKT